MAGHGGKRSDAGRPRELSDDDRQEVAHDFVARMQHARERKWPRGYRKPIIADLADTYDVTERMIVRCINEFVPAIRAANRKVKFGRDLS